MDMTTRPAGRGIGRRVVRRTAVAYAAGCAGGLANSLVVWAGGALGATVALGVDIAPALTPAWLYPRIVWGGLWAFLFLVPVLARRPWWRRGLVFSLAPTLATWLVVFPLAAGKGLFGLDLGLLTPALVVVFNAVWGLVTAATIALANADDVRDGSTRSVAP